MHQDDVSPMPALTEAVIRRAAPRARKYEIPCSRTRGLRLRVLPSGKKVFVVRVRVEGRERRASIGAVGDVSLAEARRRVSAMALGSAGATSRAPTRRASGGSERDQAARAERQTTFRELVGLYLDRHVHTDALRPATRRNYERALKLLEREFGTMTLHELRFHHVEAFHRSLGDRKSAANYYVRVLNHMFTKAAQWDLYPWGARVPTKGLTYYREEGRERFLTAAERRRLERVLGDAEARPENSKGAIRWSHCAAIRLLALTGCRESEILDLEWRWIDWRAGVLRLPDSKTGKSVRPVSDDVLSYLRDLEVQRRRPELPWVLYGKKGQRIHPSSLTSAWRRVRRRAGLDDVRIHDLRHSAASDALMAGVPLEVVGEILGHKSIRTTKRYAHLSNEVTRAATSKMTSAILRGSGGRRRRR